MFTYLCTDQYARMTRGAVRQPGAVDPQKSDEEVRPGSAMNVRLLPADPTDCANHEQANVEAPTEGPRLSCPFAL
jgi:hypothetical protein